MSSRSLRVLLLEDHPFDADLIIRSLRRAGFQLQWQRVETEAEYLASLHPDLDIILADYTLPQFTAPKALALLQAQQFDIPFIVITGTISEEAAVACMKQGAADYLLKDRLTRLGLAVEHALQEKQLRDGKREVEQVLQQSEEYFRSLIEHTSDVITVLDTNGTVRYASPSIQRVLGYTCEAIGEQDVFALMHPDDQPRAREVFTQTVQQSGVAHTIELRLRHSNQTWRTLEAVGKHVANGVNGMGEMIITNFRDITERKRHENEQQAIIAMSAALRKAAHRADIITIVLDKLLEMLEVDGVALALYQPNTESVVVEQARGVWTPAVGQVIQLGSVWQVLTTGQPFFSDCLSVDLNENAFDALCHGQALGCIPLTPQDYTIGALCICHKPPIFEDERRLLLAIADLAANAINRATLHEQTERRAQHLSALHAIDMAITASLDLRLTFDIVLDQVITHMGVDAASVLLLNPHTHALEYAAGRGFRTPAITHSRLRHSEGYVGQITGGRRVLIVPDMRRYDQPFVRTQLLRDEGFMAYYGAPLVAKGQIKGVLELFRRDVWQPDTEWQDLLEALATQTAIAIETMELFNKLQRSNTDLALAYEATLEGWVKALDLRDNETEGHTRRVTEMTVQLARMLGMPDQEIVHVRRGALLHDIGKMAIPDNILLKPGPLTDVEWRVMRKHPVYAYEWLEPITFLRPALDIPYYHHEKWDGSGYPMGLQGHQIPLSARIFSVIDVWDALSSDRPYRKGWPAQQVHAYIRSLAGKHFDAEVVQMFLRCTTDDLTGR